MEDGWQCVYIGNQLYLVEIVRSVLKEHEIDSFIVDKRDSSYITVGDIEVYVRNEEAILAKIIIEENVH